MIIAPCGTNPPRDDKRTMLGRDVSFPIALIGSLALHGVLLVVFARQFPAPAPRIEPKPTLWVDQTDPPEVTEALGNQDSEGKATDFSPGDLPHLAKLSNQEQALLSLDPSGTGRRSDAAKPLSQRIDETNPIDTPPDAPIGLSERTQPHEPYRPHPQVASTGELQPEKEDAKEPPTETLTEVATQSSEQKVEERTQQPPEPPQPVRETNPTPPSPMQQASVASTDGVPIPQGKTESDSFSDEASVDVRPGKVIARTGRPHRITRPREGLSGLIDALASPGMTLTLRLRLSPTGDVIDVSVVRSSGSNSIDQPWKVAAYSWWFEPKKEGNGRPIEDTVQLTLRFM